jgi:hypothetical protein
MDLLTQFLSERSFVAQSAILDRGGGGAVLVPKRG